MMGGAVVSGARSWWAPLRYQSFVQSRFTFSCTLSTSAALVGVLKLLRADTAKVAVSSGADVEGVDVVGDVRSRDLAASPPRVRRAMTSALGARFRERVDSALLHGDERCHRPCGCEVDHGDQLRHVGGGEDPVSPHQRHQRRAHRDVECVVERRGGALHEQREQPELDGVGDHREGAGSEDSLA